MELGFKRGARFSDHHSFDEPGNATRLLGCARRPGQRTQKQERESSKEEWRKIDHCHIVPRAVASTGITPNLSFEPARLMSLSLHERRNGLNPAQLYARPNWSRAAEHRRRAARTARWSPRR